MHLCESTNLRWTIDFRIVFWFMIPFYFIVHNESTPSVYSCVFFLDLLLTVISGADLTCSYSADFGSSARVEWKFNDQKGSQVYVVFDGKPTGKQIHNLFVFFL